jgi:hypothetical protein
MFRRLVPLLALAILAGLPAGSALAAPSCVADMSQLRYRPHYTVSCAGQTIDSVELVKTSNGASVGITTGGVGTSDVTVDGNGTLASDMQYRLKLMVDDGLGGGDQLWTQTFRTLKPPAHANLHVEYITAIPADAVLDMAQRIDKANVVAVPTNGDFIDASTRSLSESAYTAALKHHQSALVVTDEPVLNSPGLGKALNAYCNHGHGVVLAGQTHWIPGPNSGWSIASAIGPPGGPWEKHWSLYYYEDIAPDRITGGDLAAGSVQPHFLTKGLTDFHVVGAGSGAVELRDYAQGHVLARLKRPGSGFYNTYGGQFLVSEHQINGGRVVDLGYNPWSTDVLSGNGGFDPAQSPGGSLLTRSLWWATNRIPPTNTHFTSKPPSTSTRATVIVAMGAKDADKENSFDIHFRYRVDGGGWHWAVGTSFVLYHLSTGRHHTIYAQAFDDGGNRDRHVARYTFYVTPGAIG